jgi:hypothetical protein
LQTIAAEALVAEASIAPSPRTGSTDIFNNRFMNNLQKPPQRQRSNDMQNANGGANAAPPQRFLANRQRTPATPPED